MQRGQRSPNILTNKKKGCTWQGEHLQSSCRNTMMAVNLRLSNIMFAIELQQQHLTNHVETKNALDFHCLVLIGVELMIFHVKTQINIE